MGLVSRLLGKQLPVRFSVASLGRFLAGVLWSLWSGFESLLGNQRASAVHGRSTRPTMGLDDSRGKGAGNGGFPGDRRRLSTSL